MKKILYFSLLLTAVLSSAQTYTWQWAKSGGGSTGSSGSGFSETRDEMIRDVVIDNNNNSYYLTKIYPQNPNIDGTPVTSYENSDLLLFSLDCQGNLRWKRTIGGRGDSEFAWKINVDNNGGLYMMAVTYNSSNSGSTTLPTRFGDGVNDVLPQITTPYSQTSTVVDPGLNTAFLLKYNSSDGTLEWRKNIQGDVTWPTRNSDIAAWCMDSNHNIHAVVGLLGGSHLNNSVTVPSSFNTTTPNSFQYYLVKFNYVNNSGIGDMVLAPNSVLLPLTGSMEAGTIGGKVQFTYDETLNRYYIAGSTSTSFQDYLSLSFNNSPLSNDGYMLAINGSDGSLAWRKEFSTYISGSPSTAPDEKIYSLIKDDSGNLYLSGRYFQGGATPPPTFGSYQLPFAQTGNQNFVMKLNPDGNVLWCKIPTATNSTATFTRSTRARIALNGNEIAFVKGHRGEVWDNFTVDYLQNDLFNSLLVRLNKDTGSAIGIHPILSTYGSDDELTSVAVDNDGNYVVGGYFTTSIFTDSTDNIPTVTNSGNQSKSQFYAAKLAKSACSNMATVETPVKETDLVFYPNPVEDVLQIKTKEKLDSYQVITADGRLVRSGDFKGTAYTVQMQGISPGTYYVKVKGEKFSTAGKIIKK